MNQGDLVGELKQLDWVRGPELGAEPSESRGIRSKTALRMRYESEARVIREQLGSLESVRNRLGLSQRKICQLLLVDPSAWTRWVANEAKTPPHILRALQWYLALEQKDPAWQQWREFILKREADPPLDRWRRALEDRVEKAVEAKSRPQQVVAHPTEEIESLRRDNLRLDRELERRTAVGAGWKMLLVLNTLALLAILLRAFFF